jgi:hypothetical protein
LLNAEGVGEIATEVDRIISSAKTVQTEADYRAFFTKDLSDMADHRG